MLDGAYGAHHRVELEVFRHLILAADASRVNQIEVKAELIKTSVDAIAGGTGYLSHNVAILAYEGVDNAALAGVGTAHHSEARYVVLDILLVLGGQTIQYGIEQVARATSCGCADAERLAQAQFVKLGGLIVFRTVVHLIGYKYHGQLGAAQYEGHILVPVCQTGLHIYQEEHQVGLLGGHKYLLAYSVLEHVVRVDYPSPGVHYRKFLTVP